VEHTTVANPNPHAARLAKRRAHKPLNLADVLKIMTRAIREAEYGLLTTVDDVELSLRCVHSLGFFIFSVPEVPITPG